MLLATSKYWPAFICAQVRSKQIEIETFFMLEQFPVILHKNYHATIMTGVIMSVNNDFVEIFEKEVESV